VLQIAIAVGYENASHFSVQFKRDYGVTPLGYRLRG
jgi:AraC family transcriptional regulator